MATEKKKLKVNVKKLAALAPAQLNKAAGGVSISDAHYQDQYTGQTADQVTKSIGPPPGALARSRRPRR